MGWIFYVLPLLEPYLAHDILFHYVVCAFSPVGLVLGDVVQFGSY